MLAKTKKESIVHNFEIHSGDTGSPEVQIAILTERINELTEHLKSPPQGPLLSQRPAQNGCHKGVAAQVRRQKRPKALSRHHLPSRLAEIAQNTIALAALRPYAMRPGFL